MKSQKSQAYHRMAEFILGMNYPSETNCVSETGNSSSNINSASDNSSLV